VSYSQESNFYLFQNQQLLAIDYGEKVTGIATFIPGNDPFPLMGERILFKSKPQLTKSVIKQANELDVQALVLGKPLLTDGRVSDMTKKVLSFGQFLADQSGLPVYLQDETLSTETAKDRMKNSPEFNFKVDLKKIDCLSAVIILEDFLKANDSDKLD
jgi:putative Holliday junction resolvase